MAEGSYEHACMRAELLGLERPNRDDFVQRNLPAQQELEAAQFEDISLQNEEYRQVGGGLNELNSILTGTQKKINKLKGMYGSLTDLLKNKLGGSKDDMSFSTDPSYVPMEKAGSSSGAVGNAGRPAAVNAESHPGKHIHQEISSQVDKLDALLDKADRAQCSMDSQNKQMKSFLRK